MTNPFFLMHGSQVVPLPDQSVNRALISRQILTVQNYFNYTVYIEALLGLLGVPGFGSVRKGKQLFFLLYATNWQLGVGSNGQSDIAVGKVCYRKKNALCPTV